MRFEKSAREIILKSYIIMRIVQLMGFNILQYIVTMLALDQQVMEFDL